MHGFMHALHKLLQNECYKMYVAFYSKMLNIIYFNKRAGQFKYFDK